MVLINTDALLSIATRLIKTNAISSTVTNGLIVLMVQLNNDVDGLMMKNDNW